VPRWTGNWKGGRTYTTQDGRTVWVIQKDVHGTTRSITLDVRNLAEAEAELGLFNPDRAAYLTRTQADQKADAETVRVTVETVGRFPGVPEGGRGGPSGTGRTYPAR